MSKTILPVFIYNVDAKKAIADLDRVLVSIRRSPRINLEVGNSAVLTRDNGPEISLYKLLDEGTAPHQIGDRNSILANKEKAFGPVHGPVQHPGTPSHDISARATTYAEALLNNKLTGLAASSKDFIKLVDLEKLFAGIGIDIVKFAQEITPDIWTHVKKSFGASLRGRALSLEE